jgi:ketosteroid isomerase-like protein
MTANSPEEVDHLFVRYMREGNIESVLDLYDPGVVFVNSSGIVKKGVSVIREELAPFAVTNQLFEFNIKKIVQNGDIALVHNQWEMISPQKMSGHAIEVMRRQSDGSWRFFIGDPFTVSR